MEIGRVFAHGGEWKVTLRAGAECYEGQPVFGAEALQAKLDAVRLPAHLDGVDVGKLLETAVVVLDASGFPRSARAVQLALDAARAMWLAENAQPAIRSKQPVDSKGRKPGTSSF